MDVMPVFDFGGGEVGVVGMGMEERRDGSRGGRESLETDAGIDDGYEESVVDDGKGGNTYVDTMVCLS